MDEINVQEQEVVVEETVEAPAEFEEQPVVEETPVVEEVPVEFEEQPVEETVEELPAEITPSEFAESSVTIQVNTQLEELQATYEQLKNDFEAMKASIEEARSENETLKTELAKYQAKEAAQIIEKKNALIAQYKKIMSEEEISVIEGEDNDMSYEELESKLAVAFARKQIPETEAEVKIPLPEPEESQFALLMKKYRKN